MVKSLRFLLQFIHVFLVRRDENITVGTFCNLFFQSTGAFINRHNLIIIFIFI